jgi:hypothetical protein
MSQKGSSALELQDIGLTVPPTLNVPDRDDPFSSKESALRPLESYHDLEDLAADPLH